MLFDIPSSCSDDQVDVVTANAATEHDTKVVTRLVLFGRPGEPQHDFLCMLWRYCRVQWTISVLTSTLSTTTNTPVSTARCADQLDHARFDGGKQNKLFFTTCAIATGMHQD